LQKIPYKLIECGDSELIEKLTPLLIGQVFHVTPPEGYKGIRQAGYIKRNINNQFPPTFCKKSETSLARLKGHISLVDLRDLEVDQIDAGRGLFDFYDPPVFNSFYTEHNPFFLFLSEELYPNLVKYTQEECQKENCKGHAVATPIEVGIPRDIPLSKIEMVLEVRIHGDSMARTLEEAFKNSRCPS